MGRGNKVSDGPPQEDPYEWEYARPIETMTKWQRTLHFIYNGDENKILGRTPKGWGQILVFYSCFYAVLAAMFALCLKGLMYTIDLQNPRYTLDQSLIGSNPGMGFRPMPPNPEDGSVIRFVASNHTNTKLWTDALDKYLEEYEEARRVGKKGGQRQVCSYDREPNKGKSCTVDLKQMKSCSPKNQYGYPSASPCIFLKLNRIFGWVPEYYNESSSLPDDMPQWLKDHIKTLEVENKNNMLNTVWVSCEGEGPPDNEYMNEVEYYPQPGFPGYYYPYTNLDGYLSPLVAVHFKRPAMRVLVNVECRVWAKNVFYGRSPQGREGSVHFEILVDP